MKKVLWLVLIVIVVLVGWRIFQSISDKSTSNERGFGGPGGVTPVETTPVQTMTMRDLGRFSGSLKAKNSYTLAARTAGRLERLLVNIGDKVSNGQVIAVLDDAVYQQDLEQAKANLAVAQAQVEQLRLALKAAEGNWQTVKRLFEQNFESQAMMDKIDAEYASAQAKYDTALAEVQKAQSVLTKSEIQLSYTQINATWTGGGSTRLVGERLADEGNMLSINAPIMTLVDNSIVTAEIDVIERDYVRIHVGQAVEIRTDAYPDRVFQGKLVRLAPVLNEASRQARAEIDIPNPNGLLKPGMFVRVLIVYEKHDNVTVIPVASLVKREGLSGVFVADKDSLAARFVPLTIGIIDNENAEVVEPELSGEVITLGQQQLQDGSKIKLPQQNGADKSEKDKSGVKQ
ncbi:MAG: efflux RND transporter periplasmic adaptor subunit [Candidatus Cloacimonadaceae bacterium]